MTSRALSVVGALVLLFSGSMAGAAVTLKDQDRQPGDLIAGIPSDCVDYERVGKMLDYLTSGGKAGIKGYQCTGPNNVTYYLNIGHIAAAIDDVPGGYRKDGVLSESSSGCDWTGAARCSERATLSDNETFVGMWAPGQLGAPSPSYITVSLYKDFQTVWHTQASELFTRNIEQVNDVYKGYTNVDSRFYRQSFNAAFIGVVTTGKQVAMPSAFPLPDSEAGGYTPAPPGDPGGGTSTPGGPACTRPDGSTSGNPYDCAPTDSESNCSIIDLPCNLKRLFIPRQDFLKTEMFSLITKDFNMPAQITDKIEVDIPLLGQTYKMGLNFGSWLMNSTFEGLVKLMCAFSCFYWLLNFLGIPNPFGGSVRGNTDLDGAVRTARIKAFDRGKK